MTRIALLGLAAATLVTESRAQCSLQAAALTGLDGAVYTSAAWDPDGAGPLPPRLLVGGSFTTAGGLTANGVAAYDLQTGSWSVFGTGVSGAVYCVVALPGGSFAVGGTFASAGGVPANNVALWTGTGWAALGAGWPSPMTVMLGAPNGELLAAHAGASFVVSRWDGVGWTTLGSSAPGVHLAVTDTGDILVGGWSGIWRWTGTAWVPHASGVTHAWSLATLPGGRLFAAVSYLAPHFAIFDGTTWTQLGGTITRGYSGPIVSDVEVLPSGDLAVSGFFTFGLPGPGHFMRWNGSTWTPLGGNPAGNGSITTLTFMPEGQLFAGSALSNYLGRLASTCAAQSAPSGAGCASTGGANALAVEKLPWIGSTYRARATGLPAVALVTEVYGFSPLALPLASVLPQGQPGCLLHVWPDFIDLTIAVAGTATTELVVPAASSLVGIGFHNQMNVFELDATGTIAAVTASNALSLTVGAF
ncbi:MAG TPA: hypothetical protein VF384_07050 [Planctomycetota bacterium]